MNNHINLGWVGVRGYGKRFWDSIKNSPLCHVAACFHPNTQVVNEAAERMECCPFTEFDGLLNFKEVDALIVTVPNEFHFDYAKRALEAGKHVLVEKPLTNTLAEAMELMKLAEEKSLVLMVGHNYRKNDFLVRLKEELERGRIGKPVAAEFNMGHGGGLKFKPDKWRFYREKCPGGPLNMLGTHMIDASNYLFGKVIKVNGIVKNLYAETTAEDMSLIQLVYQSGVVVNITNLYNSVSTEFINVYGTEGALRFSRWPETGLWFQPKDIDCDCTPYEPLVYRKNNTSAEIFEGFIKAIQDDGNHLNNIQNAVETVRIMEEALKL